MSFPKDIRLSHSPTSLRSLKLQCGALFTSAVSRSTLSILLSSSLQSLSLTRVNITPHTWTTLLDLLTFPELHHFEVDDHCPLRALIDFLRRHPDVESLGIYSSYDTRPKGFLRSSSVGTVSLPKVMCLRGPIAYISALATRLDIPETVTSVTLAVGEKPPRCYLSNILACTEVFCRLEDLGIQFNALKPVAKASLCYPKGESRICCARELRLSCFSSYGTIEGGDILSNCTSWLPAFPRVACLKLNLCYDIVNGDDIREAFLRSAALQGQSLLIV
ncbi:hypothetical protein JVU11DRAFT_3283 [Chiua virens]|nr:hypothetical protein JVU11DRAFT_3283 [Chiua virens]